MTFNTQQAMANLDLFAGLASICDCMLSSDNSDTNNDRDNNDSDNNDHKQQTLSTLSHANSTTHHEISNFMTTDYENKVPRSQDHRSLLIDILMIFTRVTLDIGMLSITVTTSILSIVSLIFVIFILVVIVITIIVIVIFVTIVNVI